MATKYDQLRYQHLEMERTGIPTPTEFFPLAFGTQTTVAWVDTSHQVDINKLSLIQKTKARTIQTTKDALLKLCHFQNGRLLPWQGQPA